MPIAIDDIKKLSAAEKVELYHLLEGDPDVAAYATQEATDELLFQEINIRDEAYRKGTIHLTTIADLEQRLQTHQ